MQKQWLGDVIKHVDANPKGLLPVLEEFRDMINNDTRLYLLFNSMFEQIPSKKPYSTDPTGHRQIRDPEHMLRLLNHIITTAPGWNDRSFAVGLVGLPMNALLDWPMATPSGWAVFLDPQINSMFKKVLHVWGEFLRSPESAKVLDERSDGWLGRHGKKDLTAAANVGETNYSFEEMFQCTPSERYHGFKSWDSFFIRLYHDHIRPVAAPDHPEIIANACESLPYKVAYGVSARDKFWVKGQPYSVQDMLAHDKRSGEFVGGTIYQAFLSPLSYHRWHSPVDGVIIAAYVKDGTYFSEPLFEGFADPHGADPFGEKTGQGYLTATATRAIIFIEADNKEIGLMCVMPVGMVEVSTCEITVKEGQHVKKGEQLGMVSRLSRLG